MNKLKKLGLTALCLACVSSVNASTIEEVSTEKGTCVLLNVNLKITEFKISADYNKEISFDLCDNSNSGYNFNKNNIGFDKKNLQGNTSSSNLSLLKTAIALNHTKEAVNLLKEEELNIKFSSYNRNYDKYRELYIVDNRYIKENFIEREINVVLPILNDKEILIYSDNDRKYTIKVTQK
jgi:hypothetical protein